MEELFAELEEICAPRFRDWRKVMWWSELTLLVLAVALGAAAFFEQSVLVIGLMLAIVYLLLFIREEQTKARIRNAIEREYVRREPLL